MNSCIFGYDFRFQKREQALRQFEKGARGGESISSLASRERGGPTKGDAEVLRCHCVLY